MKLHEHPWYIRWALTIQVAVIWALSALVGAPVAWGMADEVTTTVLTNDEATEYIAEKTLRIALVRLALYQFGEKHTLPERSGRLFQLTRYEHLTLPQNPLIQGTTPANTPMTISKVSALAEQWGAVITMYDVPLLTIKHDVLQKAIELLGMQAAKVLEREMQRTLQACTTTYFAGTSNTTRNGLASGDYLTSLEIQKIVAKLRDNGAEEFTRSSSNTNSAYLERVGASGGGTKAAETTLGEAYAGFIGIIDPFVEQDLIQDSTFKAAAEYQNIRALYAGEVGRWLGVVFVRSNLMPYITLLASPTTNTANMTVMSGGFSAGTPYDISVTRARDAYGLEEAVSAKIDQSTGGGDDALSVTLPATAGYHYYVYVGANSATRYQVQTASSATTTAADDIIGPAFGPNQTIYITALPTDGLTSPVDPASQVTVHQTWIFGREAFGVVDLAKLQATLTPNTASDSDPLIQRRKAGWKVMFKCCIQNDNFIALVESSSAYSS